MKIAYNQACTLYNSNLELDLRLCEAADFDAFELRIDKLREYLCTHTVDDLKAYFSKSRMRPYSINGIYVYADFLSDRDNPERAGKLLEDITFACEMGRAIGCDKMVMVPPVYGEQENRVYDDPWEKIVEDNVRIFSAMADFVAKYGMNIGIEIVGAPRSSVRTIEQCNVILDKVARPNVGYTIDGYNLYLYNKTNDFSGILKAYPDKIFIVHINGGEESPDDVFLQRYRTFADRGVVDVAGYLSNLNAIGYSGYVSIEFFRQDCWDRPAQWVVEECYATTKAVLEKARLLD